MLQARPLYDTKDDARFFVEPTGWDRLLRAVEHRFNVALLGSRGGGKTTVLRQLQRLLREADTPVAFVDGTQSQDVGELVAAVEHEVLGRPPAAAEALPDPFSALRGGPPGAASLRVVNHLRGLATLPATTILVDCTHAALAAHALFGRLRDELWQLPHRWVVAVEDSERSILLAPPADAFFDQVVNLELTPDELLALVHRRSTGLDDATLRRIAGQAGSPRRALQAVRDALTSPEGSGLDAALWRQDRAAALGRPHSMALAEIEALGGASASDEEFLRRLNWSRARAAQVLRELAEAGLVAPSDEQSPTRSRPRRVYRPTEPPSGAAPDVRPTEPGVPRP